MWHIIGIFLGFPGFLTLHNYRMLCSSKFSECVFGSAVANLSSR